MWQESLLLVTLALILAIVMKSFIVQAFYIPSESMEPGLIKNDRIAVQRVSYWFGGTPQRGDVVVFEDPGGWLDAAETAGPTNIVGKVLSRTGLYPSGGHLVKRVIGVAGDTIVCCDDQGRLSVNGVPLDEDAYIEPQQKCNGPMISTRDWTAGPVPDGKVFVMGDNRSNSFDSSAHLCTPDSTNCVDSDAYISTQLVVGKVVALIWPANRFTLFSKPTVFTSIPDND